MWGDQDFNELRLKHLRDNNLFHDPEFPAHSISIYYSKKARDVVWKRPMELVDDPQFFVEGGSRFDVNQGELGDCWLMAAMANLTLNESYFQRVVPPGQSFEEGFYAGIFHFRFWQYGEWIDVVVDDRLPTRNGKLLFLRSKDPNEFWSALLEKAYAKLHGSYEALSGGLPYEALEDFTGGVAEMYQLKKDRHELFQIMSGAFQRSSLMCCYILGKFFKIEEHAPQGLIRRHAYSITCVRQVTLRGHGKLQMVRLRNPWGTDAEWKGPWSDQSAEWRNVPSSEKRDVGLSFEADGEFWMSFTDFASHFTDVEIVSLVDDESNDQFRTHLVQGSWIKGLSAGGNISYRTYHLNPQFRIRLTGDGNENDNIVLVALMQEYDRRLLRDNIDCHWIGFQIYQVDDERAERLDRNFFKQNRPIFDSDFSDSREVTRRIRLKVPANYFIVPCTLNRKEAADFILRIHFEKTIQIHKLPAAPKQAENGFCSQS